MKNLLQRLKPEISKNLINSEKDYPNLVGSLLKELSENVAVTQLTLGDINNLASFAPNRVNTVLEMYDMFEAYKKERKNNPRIKYHLNQRSGDMVGEPLEVPLTMEGFEIFCWNKYDLTISNYFNKKEEYKEFYTVCSRIRKEIREDQITGGMVGQYNPSITQRLNALKEQIEQTNIEQPLFPDVKENDSDQ